MSTDTFAEYDDYDTRESTREANDRATEDAETGDYLNTDAEGEYQLRVVPPFVDWKPELESRGLPFVPWFFAWVHMYPRQGGQGYVSYVCPKHAKVGICEDCEEAEALKAAGSPKADRDWGFRISAKHKVGFNVINRDAEDQGPKLFKTSAPGKKPKGRTVWEMLSSKMLSTKNPRDLVHPGRGFDFVLTKTGKDMDTTYSVDIMPAPSKLSEDVELARHWIATQKKPWELMAPPDEKLLGCIKTGDFTPMREDDAPPARASARPSTTRPTASRAAASGRTQSAAPNRAQAPKPAARTTAPTAQTMVEEDDWGNEGDGGADDDQW